VLLDGYPDLEVTGLLVKVENKIKAFTFGYKVSEETFCVLFEITDLSLKGISQFIFKEFCETLQGYTYINIMDDSGLENLKRVKLSYHPVKVVVSFIAKRK
jgi:hypothetical protein